MMRRAEITEPDLWETVKPNRARKPRGVASTSDDAFRGLLPKRARCRRLIMVALWANGPMTRPEIADATGLKLSTVCGNAGVDGLLDTIINPGTDMAMVHELRASDGGRYLLRNKCKIVAPTYYPQGTR